MEYKRAFKKPVVLQNLCKEFRNRNFLITMACLLLPWGTKETIRTELCE